ncbi:MAG: hypothetical protein AABY16_01775 [Nanoarchaeota archaeon]
MFNFWLIIITAVIVEIITIVGRFKFNISTKNFWVSVMRHFNKKHWVHVHHIFLGLIISALALILESNLALNLGIGIALSDAVHHFLVLWPLVGSPEFHIMYKNKALLTEEQLLENEKLHKVIKHLFHHS